MQKIATFLLCLLCTIQAAGQDNESIFPDLEGEDLFNAVVGEYNPASVLSYADARDTMFSMIDKENGGLECVYTGWVVPLPEGQDPTQAVYQNGSGINTEHTWPQAFGAGVEPARANMHHLFPTRVDVNGARGNLRFGESPDNATDDWFIDDYSQSGIPSQNIDFHSEVLENSVFEPRELHKGNVARAMFYFYTIYRNQADDEFFDNQQNVLCDWNVQDPIDAAEWDRTWLIANYQDDKPNPFVLDCTLAQRMYCPDEMSTACISSTDDPNDPNAVPIIIAGAQPNPSYGIVKIPYEIRSNGRLEVNWYDVNGRHYRKESKVLSPGEYQLTTIPEFPGYWICEFIFNDGEMRYQKSISVIVLP